MNDTQIENIKNQIKDMTINHINKQLTTVHKYAVVVFHRYTNYSIMFSVSISIDKLTMQIMDLWMPVQGGPLSRSKRDRNNVFGCMFDVNKLVEEMSEWSNNNYIAILHIYDLIDYLNQLTVSTGCRYLVNVNQVSIDYNGEGNILDIYLDDNNIIVKIMVSNTAKELEPHIDRYIGTKLEGLIIDN